MLPQKPEGQEETLKLITPTDEKVEVIKVCVVVCLCSCVVFEVFDSSSVLSFTTGFP